MGKKGFFAWLIGLFTGTALGVLFAPRKGKETRDRIRKAREEGGVGHEPIFDDVKKLGDEISRAASGVYEESVLREYIDEWRNKLSDLAGGFVSEFSEEAGEKIRQGKRIVKEGKRIYRAGRKVAEEAAGKMKNVVRKKGKKK